MRCYHRAAHKCTLTTPQRSSSARPAARAGRRPALEAARAASSPRGTGHASTPPSGERSWAGLGQGAQRARHHICICAPRVTVQCWHLRAAGLAPLPPPHRAPLGHVGARYRRATSAARGGRASSGGCARQGGGAAGAAWLVRARRCRSLTAPRRVAARPGLACDRRPGSICREGRRREPRSRAAEACSAARRSPGVPAASPPPPRAAARTLRQLCRHGQGVQGQA